MVWEIYRLMNIPDRNPYSDYGQECCSKIPQPLNHDREEKLLQEVLSGNIPDFLRSFSPVVISENGKTLTLNVACDYLSLGHDTDYVRIPLNPHSAQKICDAWGCMLPTRKMVNLIWKNAEIKLAPSPMPPTNQMTTTEWFVKHSVKVDGMLSTHQAQLGQLIAGHKKDVVVTTKIENIKNRVAIYGWHQLNGVPIQGLNPTSHDNLYADYSHGIRLIDRVADLDGQKVDLYDILSDPSNCSLVSDEGILKQPYYVGA